MIQFLVHTKSDSVGVATLDINPGEKVQGLYMDTQERIQVKALNSIPLGHKIALKDHAVDEGVIKYGHDVGKVVAKIKKGAHVHTENLKTRRW